MNIKLILAGLTFSTVLVVEVIAAENDQEADMPKIKFATADFVNEDKKQQIALELPSKARTSTQIVINHRQFRTVPIDTCTDDMAFVITGIHAWKYANPQTNGCTIESYVHIRGQENFRAELINPHSSLIQSIIKKERDGTYTLSFYEHYKPYIHLYVEERDRPISYSVSYTLKRQ